MEGGSGAPRAMPAHARSGKILLGSALLVYQCAFRRLVCHRARSTRSTRCLSIRDGFFISLLSGTPDGARLMLLCLL